MWDSITLAQAGIDTKAQKQNSLESTLPSGTVVYPNPAKNEMNITLAGNYGLDRPVALQLHDLYRQLRWQEVWLARPVEPRSIDLHGFAYGMYLCAIQQEGTIEHLNVSKQ